jgi:hypothetical protein
MGNYEQLVREKTRELETRYSTEADYSSQCDLWTRGLHDGLVSQYLYDIVRESYGRLWTYVGD